MGRRGYALLAVLWICTGVSALALATSEAARRALASSRNRIALTEAGWNAHACLTYARSALITATARELRVPGERRSITWNRLNDVMNSTPPPGELRCDLSLRAVGSRWDVNSIAHDTLTILLRSAGVKEGDADSLATALIEWRRSNRAFTDRRQLTSRFGVGLPTLVDSVLDVEAGPPALNHAPPAILVLLPGFTPEAVEGIVEMRRRGEMFRSFQDVSAILMDETRHAYDREFAALAGLVTIDPGAWVLTARGNAGTPPVTVVVELRIERADESSAVTRRRTWIE